MVRKGLQPEKDPLPQASAQQKIPCPGLQPGDKKEARNSRGE